MGAPPHAWTLQPVFASADDLGAFRGVPSDLVARFIAPLSMCARVRFLCCVCKSFRAMRSDPRFFPTVTLTDRVKYPLELLSICPALMGCRRLELISGDMLDSAGCTRLFKEFAWTQLQSLRVTHKVRSNHEEAQAGPR